MAFGSRLVDVGASEILPKSAPTTITIFLTQHVGWFDTEGGKHSASSMNDVTLPLHLAAKAKQIGAGHDINSPLRKQHGGSTVAVPSTIKCIKLQSTKTVTVLTIASQSMKAATSQSVARSACRSAGRRSTFSMATSAALGAT